MYARIERVDAVCDTAEIVLAGRQHAAALGRLSGFVAFALLSEDDGTLLAVSLFEDEAGLRDAAALPELIRCIAPMSSVQTPSAARVTNCEVLVQKGL